MKIYSLGWAALGLALLTIVAGLGITVDEEPPTARGSSAGAVSLDTLDIDWGASDVRISDPTARFPGAEQNLFEPTIAIDPTDPMNVLAFSLDFSIQNHNPDGWSVIRGFRSQDGGATWTDTGVLDFDPNSEIVWDSGDPVVQFLDDGTAYLSSLGYRPDGARNVFIHRSSDHGASWQVIAEPVVETVYPAENLCGGPDKEWLSVDATTGALYLVWTDFRSSCETIDPIVGLDGVLLGDVRLGFTSSDDGGLTWTPHQFLHRGWTFGQPEVGPDGTIYVAYWTSTEQPIEPCPSALAVVATRTQPFAAIGVATSRDGGATWSYHLQGACSFPELADAIKPGRNAGGNFQIAMAVDPITGAAHVAYPTLVGQRYTVKVISSSDAGASWGAPVDATPGIIDHASLPAIFAHDGLVGISYQLGRMDGTGDTMFTGSADGGMTYAAPTRLSSASAQLGRLPDAGPERDPHTGDYWHIDFAAGKIAVVWADARASPVEIYARIGTLTT